MSFTANDDFFAPTTPQDNGINWDAIRATGVCRKCGGPTLAFSGDYRNGDGSWQHLRDSVCESTIKATS